MSFHFLRLFTHSFGVYAALGKSFGLVPDTSPDLATVRGMPAPPSTKKPPPPPPPPQQQQQQQQQQQLQKSPPNVRPLEQAGINVATTSDARFVYESLDAARGIFHAVVTIPEPEAILPFMPTRFYLYVLFAGVFLYRAMLVNLMNGEESAALRSLGVECIARLQSLNGVGPLHPATRYSQLLRLLWEKLDRAGKMREQPRPRTSDPHLNRILTTPPSEPSSSTQAGLADKSSRALEAQALADRMGRFGWMNLSALHDFLTNRVQRPAAKQAENDGSVWLGFLPIWEGWDTEAASGGTS